LRSISDRGQPTRDQTHAGGHGKAKVTRHPGKVFKKIKEYSKNQFGKKFERNFRKIF
jgi:hypothetical protein